jgi:hypothetical protein
MKSWHGRGRLTSASAVEQHLGHDPSSGSQQKPENPVASTPMRDAAAAPATKRQPLANPPDYRACLVAIARLRSGGPRAALLLIVQLSSERTLEPVRKDCSFAEKQVSRPALLFLVRSGRGMRVCRRARLPASGGLSWSWVRGGIDPGCDRSARTNRNASEAPSPPRRRSPIGVDRAMWWELLSSRAFVERVEALGGDSIEESGRRVR